MAMRLLTENVPLLAVIVEGIGSAKLIVSPLFALARAARSVPAPLSAVLVTVIVAARKWANAAASANVRQMANGMWPMVFWAFVFTPDSAKSEDEIYQRDREFFLGRQKAD